MESIASFKVATSQMKLVDLISFYLHCEQSDQSIYLYNCGKTCLIKRMTELLTFFLTAKDNEFLVIIEGINAKRTKKFLYHRQ